MSGDEPQGTPVRIDPAAMRAHAIAALEEIGTLQRGRLSKAKRVNALAKQVAQTLPQLARNVDLLASGVEQLLGERAALARQLLDATAEVKDLVAERDPAMIDEDAPCASCGALRGTLHSQACFYMHVQVGVGNDIEQARELYDKTRTRAVQRGQKLATLRAPLLDLLSEANSAGRGRLDSSDDGEPAENLAEFTARLDAILGGEDDTHG